MNIRWLLLLVILTNLGACVGGVDALSGVSLDEAIILKKINAQVNHGGRPCRRDYCTADWPLAEELAELPYWDCKAYAVAKAERLTAEFGFAPQRLEYIVVAGAPLRVPHATLLVDDHIILDSGTLCRICALEIISAPLEIIGRLPFADLEPLIKTLRLAARQTATGGHSANGLTTFSGGRASGVAEGLSGNGLERR